MSYGFDTLDLSRRRALYVDRIIKGDKPADLPVQAPTSSSLGSTSRPPTLLASTFRPRCSPAPTRSSYETFIAHDRESGAYTLRDSGRATLMATLEDAEIGITRNR
jgi:hypothetical protein